jgi:iron complex transport system substrate-binding protein
MRVAAVACLGCAVALAGWVGSSAELNELRASYASGVTGGPFPRRLTDPQGDVHTLTEPPRRIVSAALAADEILLELVPPERLAAVSYLIDDPLASASAGRAPARAVRLLGAVEPIAALDGDLVIVGSFASAESIGLLGSTGAPVLALMRFSSFSDIQDNIELLGRATGEDAKAAALNAALRARLLAVSRLPKPERPPRVLALASGYVFGGGTLVDDCIRRAGARNAAAEAGLSAEGTLSMEVVLRSDPDLVVVSAPLSEPRRRATELLEPAELWRELAAVRRGAVHALPSAWLGSISQHAILALEALALLAREPAGGT